jgi:glycosyltransferase involved in cell wall biosynthesis
MKKKRVLIHSNFCRAFTGFGKHKKNILRYLYDTGKYDIVELANGRLWNDKYLKRMPWECYGSSPHDQAFLSQIMNDENAKRQNGYGYFFIDKAIKEIKPDVYIGIEDIWGLVFWQKSWWKKLTPVIWTTLDSLPILPDAFKAAKDTEHFYVWASFAEREMNKLGYKNVKTLHGTIDTTQYYSLGNLKKQELRKKFGLRDEFIVGYVFRNQLRKSVPNLLKGFKIFQKENPTSKAKLLLHTHWSEGWDIPRLIGEIGIDPSDVLTTYFCVNCGQYEIKPFKGQEQNCRFCGGEKTQNTPNIQNGVSDAQLNEIYNLMDVYCHPFTSGGQEIPVQEAKLCELVTLVTNYSCGEDHCTGESGGFPLEWAEYREPGTQFIKASTYPSSVAKQLKKVFNMPINKRRAMGEKARQYVIDHYSIPAVGKQLEQIIDSMPFADKDAFDVEEELKSPDGEKLVKVEDYLDKDDEGKRLLIVIPQSYSDVLFCNSLLDNIKKQHPKYNIYFATDPKLLSLIEGHPAVHKVLPFHPIFENCVEIEGHGDVKGMFDIVFNPHITTQKHICYHHNANDKIQFDIKDF